MIAVAAVVGVMERMAVTSMGAAPMTSIVEATTVVAMVATRAVVVSHPVLRPKPNAHRMYAQDQVVIHTARM
jgi:hypothetical protein